MMCRTDGAATAGPVAMDSKRGRSGLGATDTRSHHAAGGDRTADPAPRLARRPSSSPTSRAAPACGSATRSRCARPWPATTSSSAPRSAASNGDVVKTTGDGMMAVFAAPVDALAAGIAAQQGLLAEPWPDTCAIRVRMGIHTGDAESRGGDYFGPAVNRTAGSCRPVMAARSCCPRRPRRSSAAGSRTARPSATSASIG